jgi:diguanylate cyclase (GGDEF)-like protein
MSSASNILMQEFARDDQPAVAAKPRILVVDDVADNREILTRRLVRRDFEVVEASGGLEALARIEAEPFDIVLLDIMMPDMSGNEVLRTLRGRFDETSLPVIMVTAKSQSEDVVESLGLGANDYITKPVDFAVAVARINAQLERRKLANADRLARLSLEKASRRLDERLEKTEQQLHEEAHLRSVSEDRLRYLAYHDPLTNLMNRQGFRDSLYQVLDQIPVTDREPVLLFIDLDGFKAVNDTYGHDVGDKLLAQFGKRLVEQLPAGAPAARLGGDEFALVIEVESTEADLRALAENLVESMSAPFVIDGKPIRVGVSCGAAWARCFTGDLDGLVKAADLAMYRAKSKGTGGVVLFETHMLEEQNQRRLLEQDFRLAVSTMQFEVFYQPIVDVRTRDIIAFEALLRWPHPTRGMISPEIFIPIAERTNLIAQIGAWALRQACQQATQWPDHISVSVNLSPIQFENPALLSTLINTLATTGLAPHRLELEITESALLGAEGRNIKMLEAIRELGVRISIDDFGTGYSSLAYLQNFRFDKIKIDKRFIQKLDNSDSDAAIVRSILLLGETIGIPTTAEGIETEIQLASVMDHGCRQGQGYLFSRPMTADDVDRFIARNDRPSQLAQ